MFSNLSWVRCVSQPDRRIVEIQVGSGLAGMTSLKSRYSHPHHRILTIRQREIAVYRSRGKWAGDLMGRL